MWNIRICENVHMHSNPETLTTFFSSGTKHSLTFFLLLVFWHEERETQFLLCWLFHLTKQTCCTSRRPQTGLTLSRFKSQLASPKPKNQLASSSVRSQLIAFFQNTKNPSPSLLGMMSFTPQSYFLSGVLIMTSVIVTSSARVCEHLRSMCVPACALSRIVLSLTKPNDKI